MTIDSLFTDARSAITVISLLTFIAIVWYAYSSKRKADYTEAANLPFADDTPEPDPSAAEARHV